ncbi:Pimeloyl-ACP methyl ester carboxylesterase [Lentzea xinjiangensis]|uniref:Pimeloyl-ACP methyl ester carboxylesterase n=1 Tax=Lentzea xinjiangensis TaxID=402600 RepID=A0A1H9M257_9PSEU|nr:alpha/beta hydrolase [Lentzea xinjiangensis]SER17173.1 Pimeloyl-ACP methyl ester carboxylesterase [Lentzea xinjiangensis]
MLGRFKDQKAQENYFATYDAILRKWPVPAEDLDVETRFGPTRVRRSGTGQGTPIVLLHGVMGTSLSWYSYVAELAERHTVYAVDTIGEPGRSVQTRPVQSGQDQADWLADVLAGLGHEKFHLVGISRGAMIALDLAMRSTDRIAGVIAFEPGGFGIIGLRFVLWSFGQMFRWLLPAPILRRIMSGDPHVRRTLAPLLLRGLKYKPHFPPLYEFTDDQLRAIEVPVHFVLGERCAVHDARAVAARVEALNPRLRAEVVPGATHALTMEQPDLTISRILTLVGDDRADLPE